MKTPWSNLLQYGTSIATIAVLLIAGLIAFAILGVAVLIGKLMIFIK